MTRTGSIRRGFRGSFEGAPHRLHPERQHTDIVILLVAYGRHIVPQQPERELGSAVKRLRHFIPMEVADRSALPSCCPCTGSRWNPCRGALASVHRSGPRVTRIATHTERPAEAQARNVAFATTVVAAPPKARAGA